MLKSVPVKSLKPNPFRRLDEYPIIRSKIDALIESFETTGYWGNVMARQVGGVYEIAYGHHRLEAIREYFGKPKSVEIIVRKLTNEQMLQIMARENMEEWGTNAWIEIETIRATIEAYGNGDIELPKIPVKTPASHVRYVRQAAAQHPFTKNTVAQFLGWTRSRGKEPNNACDCAFNAIDMIDQGFIKESDLRGLKREQLGELIASQWSIYQAHMRVAKANAKRSQEASKSAQSTDDTRERKRLEKQAAVFSEQAEVLEKRAVLEAKQFGKQSANDMRNGKASLRDVRSKADERKPSVRQQAAVLNVEEAMQKTGDLLGRIANGDDQLSAYMGVISKHMDDASERSIRELDREFAALANRLTKMRNPLLAYV